MDDNIVNKVKAAEKALAAGKENYAAGKDNGNRVGQQQLYDLLTSRELSWQAIIYDLIQSEQLDPWDIDIALLTRSYIEKIQELEESDFFISSKILLAAAILLRIKSEFLLKRYIKSLDEILFGNPEKKEKIPFSMKLDDIELFPRTPLPRQRKVTLHELMDALTKAMETEQRRIKKEIAGRQAIRDASIALPRVYINIKEKIREIYMKIIEFFRKKQEQELAFTQLAGSKREERIATFVPLLHLDFQGKINLAQEKVFEEIFITLQKNLIPRQLQEHQAQQAQQDMHFPSSDDIQSSEGSQQEEKQN